MSVEPPTSLLVLDASAVVALLIDPGESGQRVADLVPGATLHAPDLFPYEVGNVLRRRRAAGQLSQTEASLAHAAGRRLPVTCWPYEVLADRIWSLSGPLTPYDAAYVALAERLRARLVTADRRLASAVTSADVVVV